MGAITQDQLYWTLSEELSVPYVDLADEVVDFDVARSLPEDVLRRHEAMPVLRVGDELTVIVADPTNRAAAVELEALAGARVTVAMANRTAVLHLLDKAFPRLSPGPGATVEVSQSAKDLTGVAQVYALLMGALREGASEVSVEPRREEVVVRYRIDGALSARAGFGRELLGPITFRFRVLAGLRGEPAPRLARVRTRLGEHDVELEMLFLPTLFGEAVTIRIHRGSAEPPTLEDLGLDPQARAGLTGLVAGDGGLVLVTGREPRGRAALLYALARSCAAPSRKTLTIERAAAFVVPDFLQTEIPIDFVAGAVTVLSQPADALVIEDVGPAPVCAAALASAERGALVLGGLGVGTIRSALAHLAGVDALRGALLAVTRGIVEVRPAGSRFTVETLTMTDELRQELLGRRGPWTSPSF